VKFRRVTRSLLAITGLVSVSLVGLAAPSSADPCLHACGVPTPAGTVLVSTNPANVVTVSLTPIAANTIVIGNPFGIPGNPVFPGFTRTTIPTVSAGTVAVDTILIPGNPVFPGLTFPTLVIISLQAPAPTRVSTLGTTVTFTPIIPGNPV